jgi:hypothetical protein
MEELNSAEFVQPFSTIARINVGVADSNVFAYQEFHTGDDMSMSDAHVTTVVSAVNNMSSSLETSSQMTAFLPWNNPRNVIPLQMFLVIDHILTCNILPTIFLVGVPTNLLNIVIFYRQGLRDRMNFCLFSLALVDLMFVTLITVCITSPCFFEGAGDMYNLVKNSLKVVLTGVYRGFMFSSGLLTMIIAVERCLCVFHPMKAATVMSTRTMGCLIVTVVLSLQALCVQYPLKLAMGQSLDPLRNSTVYFLTSTHIYRDNAYAFDVVDNILTMIVIPFTTFAVVVVCTALTILQLRRASEWRKSSSSSATSRKEWVLVVMLVTVNCIFIVTASPGVALGLTRLLVYDFYHTRAYANLFLITHGIYLTLCALNSSINFFVYVTQSSRFRNELQTMFFCLRRPPGRGKQAVSDTMVMADRSQNETAVSELQV